MAKTASASQDVVSLTSSPLYNTISMSNSRHSSSRPSRRSTREPEPNSVKIPQTSYSLPSTPLTSSFGDSLLSKKARKSPQSDKTMPAMQKNKSDSAAESKGETQKSNRHQKSGKPNGHTRASGSQSHQLTTPTSNSKRENPQKKRKSLATEAEPIHKHKHKSGSKPSTAAPTPTQNSRKARMSMPAKLNGATKLEKDAGQPKISAKASAPARTDRKANPASRACAKASKLAPITMTHSTPKPTASVATRKGNGAIEPATSAIKADATPHDSTSRSRRRDRKSTTNFTGKIKETPPQPASVPGPNRESAEPLSHNMNTRSSRSKAAARPSNVDKPLDSPVPLMALESTPRNHEVADSVEGTSVQVYNDNFHFDYAPEMYGSGFGLDGQMDGPRSPTSLSTGTSAATRISTRIRKPTIRALESMESERQFRRSRAPSSKPESASSEGQGQKKGGVAPLEHHVPASAQPRPDLSAAQQPDTAALARRLFELAAAAVSPDPALDAGLEAKMESLRREFEAEKQGQVRKEAGLGGESRLTSSVPYVLDKTKVSEPWTDKDGWTHTGHLNKFGEEYVFVSSDYAWVYPTNTYGDNQLPQPPGRFRSREQTEKDRIFGYPPRLGERNLPRETSLPFRLEDVDEEKAKVRAREGARLRRIPVDRTMSAADIEALIAQHDDAGQREALKEAEKPAGGSRKRRRAELANDSTESGLGPKRRRPNPAAAAVDKPTLKIRFRFSNPEKAAAAATIVAETGQPSASPSKKRRLPDTEGEVAAAGSPKRRKPSPEAARPAEQGLGQSQAPGGRPRRRAAAALMAGFQSHAEERARRANARKPTVAPSAKEGEAR